MALWNPKKNIASHTEIAQMLDKYRLTVTMPQGVPFFYQIGHKTKPEWYTWALVEQHPNNSAFLMDIHTPDGERRKGYARDLIRVLQSRFDVIETQYDERKHGMSKAGAKLCLSCGFAAHKAMFKGQPSTLIWRKG